VRLNRHIHAPCSFGELRHDQWGVLAFLASTLQSQSHRVVVRHIPAQGFEHGLLHGWCAVVVQHLAQHPRHGAQVMAFRGSTGQQLRHGRYRLGQSTGGPVLAGTAFLLHQILHMGCNLDLHTFVITAHMIGKHRLAIEHANPIRAGQHRQGALYMGVRDGIVVEVKTHIRRLGHRYLKARIDRVAIHG
jgi:hypothetical protein